MAKAIRLSGTRFYFGNDDDLVLATKSGQKQIEGAVTHQARKNAIIRAANGTTG